MAGSKTTTLVFKFKFAVDTERLRHIPVPKEFQSFLDVLNLDYSRAVGQDLSNSIYKYSVSYFIVSVASRK